MQTNFNGLKMHIFSEPENQVAQKICCNSVSKQEKSLFEVSNKTYMFWNSYKIIHRDIEALSFSKLSIKIGYILLEHPVFGKVGCKEDLCQKKLIRFSPQTNVRM